MKWIYGLTTVPSRKESTLPKTLESLQAAGFPSPHLFVDGYQNPQDYQSYFGISHDIKMVTCRYPKANVFPNWYLGLLELYLRDCKADRYAMFQDDVVFSRNVRQYLEQQIYPDKGYLNLFTFFDNEFVLRAKRPDDDIVPNVTLLKVVGPWHQTKWIEPRYQNGRGALALVFDRTAVMTLLSHESMIKRMQNLDRGWRYIDGAVVTAMNLAGFCEYCHNPSLCQHIGDESSMGNPKTEKSKTWRGEQFDCLQLLAK